MKDKTAIFLYALVLFFASAAASCNGSEHESHGVEIYITAEAGISMGDIDDALDTWVWWHSSVRGVSQGRTENQLGALMGINMGVPTRCRTGAEYDANYLIIRVEPRPDWKWGLYHELLHHHYNMDGVPHGDRSHDGDVWVKLNRDWGQL